MTARYPLATARVLALIYGHAVGLKLRGARVHPHPEAALDDERESGACARGGRRASCCAIRVGSLTIVEGEAAPYVRLRRPDRHDPRP